MMHWRAGDLRTRLRWAIALPLAGWIALLPDAGFAQSPDAALRGHGGPVRAAASLADGRTLVTGSFDATIIVWDVADGAARRVLRLHDSAVNALLALADGCFVSAGEDGRLARWCGDGAKPASLVEKAHTAPVAALAGAPDGRRLASAAWDRTVRLWAPAPGDDSDRGLVPLGIAAEHKAPVNGVAFVDGGRSLASASYDGEVRVTPLDGHGQPRQVQLGTALNGLAALADGRLVLTAADGRVRVLKADLAPDFEVELPDGPLTAVAVTPDGGTIAVAGMRTPVTLIDVASRHVIRRILGPGLPIWALAVSRDGRELFTGGADRALRRWSIATGAGLREAIAEPGPIEAAPAGEEGARVFRACSACHTIRRDDGHRAGPTLAGVMGRRIATAAGYDYTEALKAMDIVWTSETIARLFEIGPNAMTPGTKMPEQRITDPADRKALVEWLARVTQP